MKLRPFTRPTIIAAIEFLAATLTQAKFDQAIVRLGFENEIELGPSKSVTAKSALLGKALMRRSEDVVATVGGSMTLAEAVVRAAVDATLPHSGKPEQPPFMRGLALDGYVVSWDETSGAPALRTALPQEIDLPVADDEVHQLLKHFGFHVPLGHLDQAIAAHTRGDWAAANSQIRSFLEGLLDDIAKKIDPQKAGSLSSSENRRAFLADQEFLSKDRNEWATDGKSYVGGLFKMLHTHGSHPGLSDDDHSTFRLHLGMITGRAFLRRLFNQR